MTQIKWWGPILLFLLAAPFLSTIDLAVARFFYQGDGQFVSNPLTQFIYTYGVVPADIAAILSLIILIGSLWIKNWKKWRAPSAVVLLTLLVGAGLIVHLVLKDHWGRPRPKQVIEFGGIQEFRPFYKPNLFNQSEPSKSFPCGHSSMGFFFFAVGLVGRRLNNYFLFYGGFLLAVILGTALSITRMAQGGHFFSDTLVTMIIMWETALFFDYLFFEKKENNR